MDGANVEKTANGQESKNAEKKSEQQKEGIKKAENIQKEKIKNAEGKPLKENKNTDTKEKAIAVEKSKSEKKEKNTPEKEKIQNDDSRKEKIKKANPNEKGVVRNDGRRATTDQASLKERYIRNSIMGHAGDILHNPQHRTKLMDSATSSDSTNADNKKSSEQREKTQDKNAEQSKKNEDKKQDFQKDLNNPSQSMDHFMEQMKTLQSIREGKNLIDTVANFSPEQLKDFNEQGQNQISDSIQKGKKLIDMVAALPPEQLKYYNYLVANEKRDQIQQNDPLDRVDENKRGEAKNLLQSIKEAKERPTYEGVQFTEYHKDNYQFTTTDFDKVELKLSSEGEKEMEGSVLFEMANDQVIDAIKDKVVEKVFGETIGTIASEVIFLKQIYDDTREHKLAFGQTFEAKEWQENQKLQKAAFSYAKLHPEKVRDQYGITPGEDHRYDFADRIVKDYKELRKLRSELNKVVAKSYPPEPPSFIQGH